MKKNKVFFIAEAGINHSGSIVKAKKLVNIAIKAGADAVKFQYYYTSELTSKKNKKAKYQFKSEKKNSHYKMLSKNEIKFEDIKNLKNYCKKKIKFIVTPFDFQSLTDLKNLKIDIYKIGSGDNDNYLFLREIAKQKKKLILSTGMISNEKLKKSVKEIKKFNKKKLTLLHCVSLYPTKMDQINLNRIKYLKKNFPNCDIGFSDHTFELETPALAVVAGAKVIEKHFTFDQKAKGPDHFFSLDPNQLKKCIELVRKSEKSISSKKNKLTIAKEKLIAKVAKKRILAREKIKKGDKFTLKNLKFKRSYRGIYASSIFDLINKKSLKNFNIDDEIF